MEAPSINFVRTLSRKSARRTHHIDKATEAIATVKQVENHLVAEGVRKKHQDITATRLVRAFEKPQSVVHDLLQSHHRQAADLKRKR